MEKIKARNMTTNKGNPVANQIVINTNHGQYFQSYATTIAFISNCEGQIFLDENGWGYSPTTSKYRNQFLGLTTAETKSMIKSGEIVLTNLN